MSTLDHYHATVTLDTDECILWPFATTKGYGVMRPGDGGPALVHRRACEFAHGPAPADRPHALHSTACTSKACYNPRHLRWGTPTENAADADRTGALQRGAANHQARLTEEQVLQIRARAAAGEQQQILAREFGVSKAALHQIVHRQTWVHLKRVQAEENASVAEYVNEHHGS